MSFKKGDLITFKDKEGYHHVRKIVDDMPGMKCYIVSMPYFSHYGQVFARWSNPKAITKAYINRKFHMMEPERAERYRKIKAGDSVSILFNVSTT